MDKPPVPPELVAEIDALAAELAVRPHPDVARKLEWLIDALVMRGQLPKDYQRRVAALTARASVELSPVADKYSVETPVIDCIARLPLCQARCCRSDVALSQQDLDEGLPFDVARPYVLPRDRATNACACLGTDRACTIYAARPAACRAYDCRTDPRVWIDFDARIPAPDAETISRTQR